MRRQQLTLDELKQNIANEWRPVHAGFAENDKGEIEKSVDIDMICEWRLDDGKVMFVTVPFETIEQLGQIVEALQSSIELLRQTLEENFGKLISLTYVWVS